MLFNVCGKLEAMIYFSFGVAKIKNFPLFILHSNRILNELQLTFFSSDIFVVFGSQSD